MKTSPNFPPKNYFTRTEWSGSIGDLGTILPLAFALIVVNGFAPERLFLLWGIVYIATGFIFKVPVSVQPLKAMSVIAIAQGLSPEFLSTTAFFYGLLFILISVSGVLRWLEKWFSQALVGGIQAGIGLILAHKAILLVLDNGLFLSTLPENLILNFALFFGVVSLLAFLQYKQQNLISFLIIVTSISVISFIPTQTITIHQTMNPVGFYLPQVRFLLDATILLMIPQLPLTLGNAVFAASDSCHRLWGPQAVRVSAPRLGFSIGIFNTFIGLFGGFPMCHGSGGMAAHAQFGGKTGGTTIIMGGFFLVLAFVPALSTLIFSIPVALLAAMLFLGAWRMVSVSNLFKFSNEMITIAIVALISLFTRNLTLALVIGFLSELLIQHYLSKKRELKQNTGDQS